MKLKLQYCIILFLIFSANISANKSIWPSCNCLANADKTFCIQFQYLQGSNRIAEFKKVCKLLFNTNEIINKKVYITNTCSIYEFEKMFGKPDEKISNNKSIYYLNLGENNCKAEVGFENLGQTITCVVYDYK